LTARQVMRRIESTAHHPPAGRDPQVGNGTLDALAAVSTGFSAPTPPPAPVPIAAPTAPAPAGPASARARGIALRGAGICLLSLVAVLVVGTVAGRSRRARDDVPGD
jgi:membrane-anchored mycosin MYCP